MIEAHHAYRVAQMTINARKWIPILEEALRFNLVAGMSYLDLTQLTCSALMPPTAEDYDHLMDWASFFNYAVDRKKRIVELPGKDEE